MEETIRPIEASLYIVFVVIIITTTITIVHTIHLAIGC